MREGWEIKKIGEVCDLMTGGTPSRSKSQYFKNGNIKWLVSGDIHNREIFDCEGRINNDGLENSNAKYLPINSVLIALNGQGKTRGTVALLRTKATCNQSLVSISPKKNVRLLPEYIYYNLHGRYEALRKLTGDSGNDRRGLNMPLIRNLDIPIPPLSEQKRIVEILDEAFAAIDKAKTNVEKNLQNAKELFESYLQNIFSNHGNDWEKDSLGNVCTLFQGLAINSKTKHALVEKSELPLLRIKDLKNNTEEQYIDPNNYPKNALVKEEDIVYTRTGSLGLVFRGRKGVLHNNSFKVVPNSRLDNDYLFIWLQNPIFKTKILSLALRAAQPDITHTIFKEQEIFIPSIKEQKQIVRKLNALEDRTKILNNSYQQKLNDLEELKKSILKKAFTGELKTEKAVVL